MATCRHSERVVPTTTVTPAVGLSTVARTVEGDDTATVDDAVRARRDEFETVETRPNDPISLTYTSGTTGPPKRPRRAIAARTRRLTPHRCGPPADDVYLVAASPSWSYGLTMGTIMSGVRGTAIGLRTRPSPRVLRDARAWDVDTTR